MARLVISSAWTALLAMSFGVGCSEPANTQASTGVGAGGAGGAPTGAGSGGATASSAASTSGPVAVAASSGASGAGGSMAFVCDPPADPGSIYETEGTSLNIEEVDPISMCKYRGDVMLVVNTAAI